MERPITGAAKAPRRLRMGVGCPPEHPTIRSPSQNTIVCKFETNDENAGSRHPTWDCTSGFARQ